MLRNPFYAGKPTPPESFIGRIRDITFAFDVISQKGHLAIYGGRGMGKSSLLNYLAAPQSWELVGYDNSGVLIVLLDCSTIAPFNPHLFWREALTLLRDKADGNTSLQIEIDLLLDADEITQDSLRAVIRRIGEQNQTLLLILDDFGVALEAHDSYSQEQMEKFVYGLRKLVLDQALGSYVSTVVASYQRLSDMGPPIPAGHSSWYNHYVFRPLKPFTLLEVDGLLSLMPEGWTLELKQGVREMAGGHPALLQTACFLLHNTWQNWQQPDINTFGREFVSATEHFYRNAWLASSEEERWILVLLALSNLGGRLNKQREYRLDGVEIILSQKDRVLRNLEDRGVLRHNQEAGRDIYTFASSVMEWWIIQEILNQTEEPQLAERQKILLNLSNKQVRQLQAILKQVWQHRDIVKSVVGWLGELAGAFAKGLK